MFILAKMFLDTDGERDTQLAGGQAFWRSVRRMPGGQYSCSCCYAFVVRGSQIYTPLHGSRGENIRYFNMKSIHFIKNEVFRRNNYGLRIYAVQTM